MISYLILIKSYISLFFSDLFSFFFILCYCQFLILFLTNEPFDFIRELAESDGFIKRGANSQRTAASLEYINKQIFLPSSSSWLPSPFTFKSLTTSSTPIYNFITSSRACKSQATSILSFSLVLPSGLTSILLLLSFNYIHNTLDGLEHWFKGGLLKFKERMEELKIWDWLRDF